MEKIKALEAKEKGQSFYKSSKPCIRCGTRERYVLSRNCRQCDILKARHRRVGQLSLDRVIKKIRRIWNKKRKNTAKQRKQTVYNSLVPCTSCGGVQRYVSGRNCVRCVREHMKFRRKNLKKY